MALAEEVFDGFVVNLERSPVPTLRAFAQCPLRVMCGGLNDWQREAKIRATVLSVRDAVPEAADLCVSDLR